MTVKSNLELCPIHSESAVPVRCLNGDKDLPEAFGRGHWHRRRFGRHVVDDVTVALWRAGKDGEGDVVAKTDEDVAPVEEQVRGGRDDSRRLAWRIHSDSELIEFCDTGTSDWS